MKILNESEFNPSLGTLIDVKDPISYNNKHNVYSINIPYEKLLMNHNKLLERRQKYFLICDKGHKSKKAVQILAFYGYDVTYIVND